MLLKGLAVGVKKVAVGALSKSIAGHTVSGPVWGNALVLCAQVGENGVHVALEGAALDGAGVHALAGGPWLMLLGGLGGGCSS